MEKSQEHVAADAVDSAMTAPELERQSPSQWTRKKKLFMASVYCLAMCNSTLSSSLPGGTSLYIRKHFSVSSPVQAALPTSVFLLGYVIGPLFFAPLSEKYGRKPISLLSFAIFTCASLGCGLAPSFKALVALRVIAGVGGATPISVIGGVYSDLYADQRTRGRATAIYTAASIVPITTGPVLFAYVSLASWRWSFHLSTIVAVCTFLLLVVTPETYEPVLRKKHESPQNQIPGHETALLQMLIVSLARPLKMLFTEPIVIFTTMYVSLIFSVLFLFFQAYPFIFRRVYNMSPQEANLALLPIGASSVLALAIFLWWDNRLHNAKRRGESWSLKEEYQRLPLACGAGPVLTASMFWLAWTSRTDVHWIVPILAGLPFGVAYMLIFIAFFNYLTDAYKIYSASAMAAASCRRSLASALLVLAADSMYEHLGPSWATSIPAFASLLMIPIPFVFMRYGPQIRGRSRICQEINKANVDNNA